MKQLKTILAGTTFFCFLLHLIVTPTDDNTIMSVVQLGLFLSAYISGFLLSALVIFNKHNE